MLKQWKHNQILSPVVPKCLTLHSVAPLLLPEIYSWGKTPGPAIGLLKSAQAVLLVNT